jgi:hypothetical protein
MNKCKRSDLKYIVSLWVLKTIFDTIRVISLGKGHQTMSTENKFENKFNVCFLKRRGRKFIQ